MSFGFATLLKKRDIKSRARFHRVRPSSDEKKIELLDTSFLRNHEVA